MTHSRYSTSKGRHNISFWFQHTQVSGWPGETSLYASDTFHSGGFLF